LNSLLDQEVDRLLRLDVNAKGEKVGSLALTPEAPGLTEFESVIPVDTSDITRLRDLVSHVSTSAFALAGPRGIGKTTLIQALTADQELFDIASIVPAPVKYDPDALLRRIHADVAKQILIRHKALELLAGMQQSMTQRTRDLRRNLAFAALGTGIFLFLVNLVHLSIIGSVGDGGIFGIILVFAAYVTLVNLNRRSFVSTGDNAEIIQNAIDALDSIRWSTEETQTAKTTFSAAKIFVGLEDTDATTRKERDRARPQLVDDLASFLHRHLELTNRWRRSQPDHIRNANSRIVIAVDELDKLSDPEQIMEAVNSLKDLFRIRDVHFLVAVSNDVMTRFALRGVVSRDAFDSSFDAVIELRRLICSESSFVLSERAIGFPLSLTAVCHAWSGGLPRDLIRVSRRCVELRRTQKISQIDELSALVISQDIAQTLTALRTTEYQAYGDADRSTPSVLTSLINDLGRIGQSDDAPQSVKTQNLNNLLSKYLYSGNRIHPSVRSPSIKLLVGGMLTVTLAGAAVSGSLAADSEKLFKVADAIAAVNSLQSETLGEVMAAAEEATVEMRNVEIPIALDLERITTSSSNSPIKGRQRGVVARRRYL
jgi:Cdc6-like AAA superfamily ATPase